MYAWVNSLGENYAGIAESWRKNGVNGRVLLGMTEEQLANSFEVNNGGMRIVLWDEISELKLRAEAKVCIFVGCLH